MILSVLRINLFLPPYTNEMVIHNCKLFQKYLLNRVYTGKYVKFYFYQQYFSNWIYFFFN